MLNGLLYLAVQGCKWRTLPERFGPWHTVSMRLSRWAKAGVLERVFAALLAEQPAAQGWEALSLDSTIIKLHPDATGSRCRGARQAIGRSRGGWTSKLHALAVDDRTVLSLARSPGQGRRCALGPRTVAPPRPASWPAGAVGGPRL